MANLLAYGGKIIGGGGSSQSGGHIIENASGTDLTQRDTLKFIGGLKATDDSTNSKTIIDDSPTRMTWTAWNALTPAQQQALPKVLITNAPDTTCTADNVSYDNTDSGLSSTDVQDAIDEVNGSVGTLSSSLANKLDKFVDYQILANSSISVTLDQHAVYLLSNSSNVSSMLTVVTTHNAAVTGTADLIQRNGFTLSYSGLSLTIANSKQYQLGVSLLKIAE